MTGTWTTADGRLLQHSDISDDHLMNIVKYCFTMNKLPDRDLLVEAAIRGLLARMGKYLPKRPGYVSPKVLAKKVR